jgi:hypothetical protein
MFFINVLSLFSPDCGEKVSGNFPTHRKATVALQKKFVAGVAHPGHETLGDALLRLIAEDRN